MKLARSLLLVTLLFGSGCGDRVAGTGATDHPDNEQTASGDGGVGGADDPGDAARPAADPVDSGLAGAPSSDGSQAAPCPKMDGGTCHEFFVVDTARNRILYVNEWQCSDPTGSVCWDVAIAGAGVNTGRQLSIVRRSDTSANRLLVSKNSGFDERALEDGEVLREVSGFSATTGAVGLPDERTLLLVRNSRLIAVASSGNSAIAECELPGTGSARVLHRASDSGLLWFARSSSIFAVDQDCTEHWSTTLPDGAQAHHVLPRSGGGFYATIVSPPAVVEYDAQGELVLNLAASEAKHPSEVVAYSSLARLGNGNFLVAIVLDGGSEPAADIPQLVELTPENDVVWTWETQILGRAGGLAVVR